MDTGQRNIVLLWGEVQKILNATGRHRTVTKNFLFSLKKKQLDPKAVSPWFAQFRIASFWKEKPHSPNVKHQIKQMMSNLPQEKKRSDFTEHQSKYLSGVDHAGGFSCAFSSRLQINTFCFLFVCLEFFVHHHVWHRKSSLLFILFVWLYWPSASYFQEIRREFLGGENKKWGRQP